MSYLVECEACAQDMSIKAMVCPSCGHPAPARQSLVGRWLIATVCALQSVLLFMVWPVLSALTMNGTFIYFIAVFLITTCILLFIASILLLMRKLTARLFFGAASASGLVPLYFLGTSGLRVMPLFSSEWCIVWIAPLVAFVALPLSDRWCVAEPAQTP